jgi:uncharacterized protein YndB with AHSA1/START domain
MDTGAGSDTVAKRNPVTVERKSDREIVVRRSFNGPARLVFEAWTKPDLFKQWWLPKSMGMVLRSLEMDARTGGSYRLDFGDGMAFFGRYLDVTPYSRIVWTNDEGGEDGSVTTVTFEEQDGKTLLVMTEAFPSKEAMDAGAGAEDAAQETFGQLDDLLAQLQG